MMDEDLKKLSEDDYLMLENLMQDFRLDQPHGNMRA
jgi:hypothetical protein